MISPSDTTPQIPFESTGPESQAADTPSANWRVALMDLVAARFALIQLESKNASQEAARRASLIAAACAAAFFAWALLIAGAVSLLADATGWPWNLVAIGLAALHLAMGIFLAQSAKPSGAAAFPVTRAEFKKDREWIENFSKNKKSND